MAGGARVLLTGSAGALGTVLDRALRSSGRDLRVLDRVEPISPREDFVLASIEDETRLIAACEGVDAVVHMAGASDPDAAWKDCLTSNINGTRTVLEAARRSGVRRVVIASSNHAVGYLRRVDGPLAADAPIRPDSLYGVSKAAAEALASYYADEFAMQIASLRIGSCFPQPTSLRELATWLSYSDLVRLVEATLSARWSGHVRVWGVSRNTRRWWSLEEGRRIGFEPQDDAERFAASLGPAVDDPYLGGRMPAHERATDPTNGSRGDLSDG